MPLAYVPGEAITVYLSIYPDKTTVALGIEEIPPTGWILTNIDSGGAWDPVHKKVKWGPFFGTETKIVSYTVTPPLSTAGIVSFTGL